MKGPSAFAELLTLAEIHFEDQIIIRLSRSADRGDIVIGERKPGKRTAKGGFKRAIQDGGSRLEKRLQYPSVPAHLLLLDHALGDEFIDGRF